MHERDPWMPAKASLMYVHLEKKPVYARMRSVVFLTGLSKVCTR